MKKIILFTALTFGSVWGFSAPTTPAPAAAPAAPVMSLTNPCPGLENDPKACAAYQGKKDFEAKVTAQESLLRADCAESKRKVTELQSKAGKACGEAKLGSGAKIESCVSQVNTCGEIDEESENDSLNQFNNAFLQSGQPLTGAAATIFEAGSANAEQCPNFSFDDYEANRKKILEAQEALTREAEEIKQKQTAALRSYKEEIRKVEKELKELPKKLKASKDEETAKIQANLAQNRADEAKQQGEISKIQIDISDATGKIADLEAKRSTELSKISDYRNKETCKKSALDLRKRLLTKKGSKSVQTALKSKKSIKDQVEGDYKACYATLQSNRREINRSFDTQIAALNTRIEKAEENIKTAKELQAEAKQAIQDAIKLLPEKEQEAAARYEEERKELVEQRDALTEEYNDGLEASQRQLAVLKTKNEEQSRLMADLGQKPKVGAKKTTSEVADEIDDLGTELKNALENCFCNQTAGSTTSEQEEAKFKIAQSVANSCPRWSSLAGKLDSEEPDDVEARSTAGQPAGAADAPKGP